MRNKIEFLDLGFQPLANYYLKKDQIKYKQKRYKLIVCFNKYNNLVSIKKTFPSKSMFNDQYPYRSSMSKTMKNSFKILSDKIKKKIKPKKILEIGSNDGSFLRNFNKKVSVGIEPCKNVEKITKKQKFNTIPEYWDLKLAKKIQRKYNSFDLIYSANTITHIKNLDEVFKSINLVLSKNGVLIIEDPSLLECLKRNTYDQFYNEHIYVFSTIALKNILKKFNLEIFKIENLSIHGGSNRYYIKKKNSLRKIEKTVKLNEKKEINFGLNKINTYFQFEKRVKKSKNKLTSIFLKFKKSNKKIIGYGATAKSTTILNYCNIDNNIIDYFFDTTKEKQNKYTPGSLIKIKKYPGYIPNDVNLVFLGAWNFKNEIFQKEKKYIKSGGKFLIHTPYPRII